MGKNLEPQYAFRCDSITIKKLEYIATQHTRTRNQEMKHIIKNHILQYEQEHGTIIINNDTNTTQETSIKNAKTKEQLNLIKINNVGNIGENNGTINM